MSLQKTVYKTNNVFRVACLTFIHLHISIIIGRSNIANCTRKSTIGIKYINLASDYIKKKLQSKLGDEPHISEYNKDLAKYKG
jgi:hypothetical protein